jgi:hypothetical protein
MDVAGFIARYSPEVARVARAARAKVRRLLPGANELVYDNYNALALAFGPTEKASDAILSLAVYPRWVSLFFARGARLPDPDHLLRGSGNRMRHIVLDRATVLDRPPVRALIRAAIEGHPNPLGHVRGRTIIKSVSVKQRPRRPPAGEPNDARHRAKSPAGVAQTPTARRARVGTSAGTRSGRRRGAPLRAIPGK